MKRTLIQYRVPVERVAENETAVAAVFAELHRLQPAGLRYGTFKLEDGVTFVHLVSIETADGTNPLQALPAFQEFTTGVKARHIERPTFRELQEIGSYELFGSG